jgi:hypothetical protein
MLFIDIPEDEEILQKVKVIYDKHKVYLDNMKENRVLISDTLSDGEISLLDQMIASLAGVLGDLNKEILGEDAPKVERLHGDYMAVAVCTFNDWKNSIEKIATDCRFMRDETAIPGNKWGGFIVCDPDDVVKCGAALNDYSSLIRWCAPTLVVVKERKRRK